MKILTLVMPYYMNSSMLEVQYDNWKSWPQDIRDQVAVVLVDDGSPEGHAIDVERPDGVDISIWRIHEDKPWNQHGARNLGAKVAETPWLLLTDMDHLILEKHIRRLLNRLPTLDVATTYMLDRRDADTGEHTIGRDGLHKPHPNSFVMTRDHYWYVGGYDEDFCGVYGTDGLFKERAFTKGGRGHLKGIALMRYSREIIPDASTTTLSRKEGREPGAKKTVKMMKEALNRQNKVMLFQYSYSKAV